MPLRPTSATEPSRGKAPRPLVICVDDEPDVLNSLRRQLRDAVPGHQIRVTTKGTEALSLLQAAVEAERPVPLLVTDQFMPGMTGEELINAVAQRYPETYQIMLTGQASTADLGRAINSGRLFRYLSKPWQYEDLAVSVRAATRAYQTDRQVEIQAAALRRAYDRSLAFFPLPYLRLLGRERLEDLERGDATALDVSVLFADIRRFTSIVESWTPKQSFDFVNRYHRATEPAITDHEGFIDEFLGDGTLAHFPGPPRSALEAGIAFSRCVDRFNEDQAARGEPVIDIGMGLHHGEVVMGVCGGDQSLRCCTIGDVVNLASRVEGLASLYRTRLVVTEQHLSLVEGAEDFAVRRLETVLAKGKAQPVTVVEVLDALPPERREPRLRTLADFQSATAFFEAGDLPAAQAAFAQVLAQDPNDVPARRFVNHC